LPRDAISRETVWLFRELGAMSLRDKVLSRAVGNLYDDVMDRIAPALQRACPTAAPRNTVSQITHHRQLLQLLALSRRYAHPLTSQGLALSRTPSILPMEVRRCLTL
jgi:hypothetical protein